MVFFFFAMWVQVKVMDINYAYTQDEIQVVLANGFIDTGRKNEKQVRGWVFSKVVLYYYAVYI